MDIKKFNNIVWCDLEIVILKIHSYTPWDNKMVYTYQVPKLQKPVVNIYICHENDEIFCNPKTYREKIMRRGLYLGHHLGLPACLRHIDDNNIAIFHHDPGKLIWCFVIKYVLTLYSIKKDMLHIKGCAVAYKNKAFIFLGRGGSGKTEVIKELCKNGAKFMANTHLLIKDNLVCGVKSNIRIRNNGCDVYLPIPNDNIYNGWLPIGGVFWVNYRTDGISLIKNIPYEYAMPNIQFFTESIVNWEMKEDIADYFNLDPYKFAETVNKINGRLSDFCKNNLMYYLNLDIFSSEGMQKTLAFMENKTI